MTLSTANKFFSFVYIVLLLLCLGYFGLDQLERAIAWGWSNKNYPVIALVVFVSILFFFYLRRKLKAAGTSKDSRLLLILTFLVLMISLFFLVGVSNLELLIFGALCFSLYLHQRLLVIDLSKISRVYLFLTSLSFFFLILYFVFTVRFLPFRDELGMTEVLLGFPLVISYIVTVLYGIYAFYKLRDS